MAIAAQANQKYSGTGEDEHSEGYRAMLDQLQKNFAKNTKGMTVLFSVATDKSALWNIYLKQFPIEDRQHYTCNECRKFFERYADLVTIDEAGNAKSVMFSTAPKGEYAYIFKELRSAIEGGTVEKAFYTEEKKWGIPVTGKWEHFAVVPPEELVWENKYGLKTAYQQEAEKIADFKTMVRALVEYNADHLETAMTIIESDALYRGETVKGPAKWLQNVILQQNATKNPIRRHNLLWKAVATAPAGFARPRGTKVGTLLDDIVSGMDLKDVRARFAAIMDPNVHNRPQSAPSASNIKEAEKIVQSMGLASALKRRFATLADVQKMWAPRTVMQGGTGGVFGHLTPKDAKKAEANLLNLPFKKMTLEKFVKTVVPTADDIEVYLNRNMPFIALVTAAHPDAQPILQWDTPENRNPVSWYVYPNGSQPEQWGARTGVYARVTALTAGPAQWNSSIKLPQHGERLIFILDGVKDSNGEKVGLGLFPEYLIGELQPVRKTIEAYSGSGVIEGLRDASACGVTYTKGINSGSLFVRVKSKSAIQNIEIDRWD